MAKIDNATLSIMRDLDSKDAQATFNTLDAGAGLAWAQLFPLKYTPNFDLKVVEGNEGLPVAANRVSFNSKAPEKTRKVLQSINLELGKISVSRSKDEKEIQIYDDLKAIAAASQDPQAAQYLVDYIYGDTEFCQMALDAQVEVQAMFTGSTGKALVNTVDKGNGDIEGDLVSFGIEDSQYSGVPKVWSDETADGLGDLIAKRKSVKNVAKPAYVYMEQAAFDDLVKQNKTRERLVSPVAQAVGAGLFGEFDLNAVNAYLRKHKLVIGIIDTEVNIEDEKGIETAVKPFKENVVVMCAKPNIGYTYFKPKKPGNSKSAIYATNAYALLTIKEEVDVDKVTTIGEAYVLPAPIARKSLRFLNVAKTTWNNGNA